MTKPERGVGEQNEGNAWNGGDNAGNRTGNAENQGGNAGNGCGNSENQDGNVGNRGENGENIIEIEKQIKTLLNPIFFLCWNWKQKKKKVELS